VTEQSPRKRQGLEGLPVNSYEVWGFDAVRSASGASDGAALVVCWIVVLLTLALAIWGSSIILDVVGGIGLLVVSMWTASKLRRGAAARRVARRVRRRETRL